jgi:hypothetical protein
MPRTVARFANEVYLGYTAAMPKPNPVILRRIAALIHLHGGLRAAARATGVDAGYLSHASRGNRAPGPKLLRVLGLAEKKIYEKA